MFLCVCVFLELSLIRVFYDKTQTEHISLQFVAYLITNMTDINCLKTEVNLNTIHKLSSFLTESMLLVYYKTNLVLLLTLICAGYGSQKMHVNTAFGHVVCF